MTESKIPNCSKCDCEYAYGDQELYICPQCAHEWPKNEDNSDEDIVKDANGVIIKNGDTVSVIKDLKIKGSSIVVKVGTKVKNIRLTKKDHDIDCKIPGIGSMGLKSQFVKKV